MHTPDEAPRYHRVRGAEGWGESGSLSLFHAPFSSTTASLRLEAERSRQRMEVRCLMSGIGKGLSAKIRSTAPGGLQNSESVRDHQRPRGPQI